MRSCLVTLAGLAVVACSVTPQSTRADRIVQARVRADQTSSARDAIDLAREIHAAAAAGDYAGNPAQHQSDVLSASYVLERATIDGAPATPEVIAWRGVLYFDVKRFIDARDVLVRSFGLAPSWLAGEHLVKIYGMVRDTAAISTTCEQTYAVLTDVNVQVQLITLCRDQLAYLVPKDQELAWLAPQSRAWFAREMARRDERALAEQEVRRIQKERAAKVARYVERCAASCHAAGVDCQSGCRGGDASCDARCRTSYDGCVDTCEAAAVKSLKTTRPQARTLGAARRTDPSDPAVATACTRSCDRGR